MVRTTCENLSPFIEMVSFRCMRLLERFLTIQANPGQFCSITISSVSLCYWVHYFSVAFEKMTSLRKYTPVSVWLFVVVEGIPMKWSCLRNVWWSTPSFGIWVVAVPSGSLFAGELCRVSCQPQQLEKIMMHVWYECSYSVKWSKIQLEFLISHLSFCWCDCFDPHKFTIMLILNGM